jgi:hypothetical protein
MYCRPVGQVIFANWLATTSAMSGKSPIHSSRRLVPRSRLVFINEIGLPYRYESRKRDQLLYCSSHPKQSMCAPATFVHNPIDRRRPVLGGGQRTQFTRATTTVASSVWRPRENSSIDVKIAQAMSSGHCAALSSAAFRRPSMPHSSPAGFAASVTPSV